MATEISSVIKRKPRRFMSLLSSAVCEWFLIVLLFLEAAFSNLLIKFAHYCELKPPCILCSRLDKGFEKKKPGYYWSLLCCSHREEISSLTSCSVHNKFADVNSMCEECLFPIAMQNKSSNSDSYRVLVGKHLVDVDKSVLQNLLLNKNIRVDSQDRRTCSCCNKLWRARSNTDRLLLELNPIGFGASKANVKPPLPRATGRSRFSRRESLKMLRDQFTGQSGDNLAHIGYSKLRFLSDSESDVHYSEDDDEGSIVVTRCLNCSRPEYENDVGRPVIIDREANLVDLSECKNVNSLPSDDLIETALLDLDWEECLNRPSSASELISFEDCKTPDGAQGFFSALAGNSKANGSAPHMGAISVLSELLSLCNVPNSPLSVRIPKKTLNDGETGGKEDMPSAQTHIEIVAKASSDDNASLSDQHNAIGQEKPSEDASSSDKREEVVAEIVFKDASSSYDYKEAVPETVFEDARSSYNHEEAVPETVFEDARSSYNHKEAVQETVFEDASSSYNHNEAVLETSPDNANSSAKHKEAVHETATDGPSSSDKHNEDVPDSSSDAARSSKKDKEAVPETSSEAVGSSDKHEEANPMTSSKTVSSSDKHEEADPMTSSEALSSSEKQNEPLSETSPDDASSLDKHKESLPQTSSDDVRSSPEAVTKASSDIAPTLEPNNGTNQTENFPKNEEVTKSPRRISILKDESRITEEGSSSSPMLRASASMKKNRFSYESLDEINVAEIEGESLVDRLKRQVEHDRNLIKTLYKDLEEEQNAAAIAANQAMAMITRLQEEKAALHMEALQYLRMMEEQSEYDMEALERANDLLAEKEKEVQDLEIELDFYRMNFLDDNGTPKLGATSNAKIPSVFSSNNTPRAPRTPRANGTVKQNFEDEKLYISQCLKKLEKKLDQAYVVGKLDHEKVNCLDSDKIKVENIGDGEDYGKENVGVSERIESASGNEGEKDLKKEITLLHERLEALETDRSFLKHISELLRNGKDGYQLVQDISHQLQELRKVNSKTAFEVAYLSIEKPNLRVCKCNHPKVECLFSALTRTLECKCLVNYLSR